MVGVGDAVCFVDEVGKPHQALVTCVFSPDPEYVPDETEQLKNTSINLVFVSSDPAKEDPYGKQIERRTSIVHQTNQQAHGHYWKELLS